MDDEKRVKAGIQEADEENEEETPKRVSGEPESHLSAIGGGGIAGAATGAAIGTAVGGPVGGAIGAAAGGLAGLAAADKAIDQLDPKIEEKYWQENFKNRPYYKAGDTYESYAAAYRFGWETASRKEFSRKTFDEAETSLQKEWQKQHGDSRDWTEVLEIVRDAFDRVHERKAK